MNNAKATFDQIIIIGSLFLIALIVGHFYGPIAGFAMILPLCLGIMLLGNPRAILLVYWLWTVVQYRVADYTQLTGYLDEALVVLCFASLSLRLIRRNKRNPEDRAIGIMFKTFFFVAVLSTLLNRVSAISTFHYYISYLSFIPVFFLARDCIRSGDSKLIFKLIIGVFILQVVLNIGWALHINPIRNPVLMGISVAKMSDFAVGTLFGCNYVAYFAIMVLLLVYNYYANPIRKGSLKLALALCVAASVQFYLSDSIHAYPMLLVAFLSVTFINRSFKNVVALLVVGMLFMAVFTVYDNYRVAKTGGAYSQSKSLSYESIRRRVDILRDNPKGIMTMEILKRTPSVGVVKSLIGEGPGNVLSTVALSRVSEKAKQYLGQFYFTYSGLASMATHSIMDQPVIGFSAILSEVGLIGTGVFFAFYIYAFLRVRRQVVKGMYTDQYQYILAASFPPILIVWASMNVLLDLLHIDFFQIGIWLLAAAVWVPFKEEADKKNMAAEVEDTGIKLST